MPFVVLQVFTSVTKYYESHRRRDFQSISHYLLAKLLEVAVNSFEIRVVRCNANIGFFGIVRLTKEICLVPPRVF